MMQTQRPIQVGLYGK